MKLRLVSWNLHGVPFTGSREARFRAVAEHIFGESPHGRRLPDFLLFQEVWFHGQRDQLSALLADVYEEVPQVRETRVGPPGGLVAFVREASSWKISGTGFRPFEREGPAWRVWEGDALANKGVQRIELERDGEHLTLLNTHLQAQYGERRYPEVRRDQLATLEAVAAEVPDEVPVVAAGDLNTTPEDPEYSEIDRFWRDLTRAYRNRCQCGTSVGSVGRWIDYVIARRSDRFGVEVLDVARHVSLRPDDPYSDHHGVDVTLRLNPVMGRSRVPLAALAAAGLRGPSTRRQWLVGLGLGAACLLG